MGSHMDAFSARHPTRSEAGKMARKILSQPGVSETYGRSRNPFVQALACILITISLWRGTEGGATWDGRIAAR